MVLISRLTELRTEEELLHKGVTCRQGRDQQTTGQMQYLKTAYQKQKKAATKAAPVGSVAPFPTAFASTPAAALSPMEPA